MKSKWHVWICTVLCFLMIFLCGCGPSLIYSFKKKQGLYPETGDFPDTKWVCREINMYFYMFDYAERRMIGEYISDGNTYRVHATFDTGKLEFLIYTAIQISPSEIGEGYVSYCPSETDGYICTEYVYKDQALVCRVAHISFNGDHDIPDTLTFEKTGTIAQRPVARWYSADTNMYIDEFDDVHGYYKGKIMIDGQSYDIRALNLGSDYYQFSIENGRINNLMKGTASSLVYMRLQRSGDEMIGEISDGVFYKPAYPDWSYQKPRVVFTRTIVE